MTCNVAFIGLGVMGYPMAGYISKAGHNVTVFNRTKSKAEKWIGEYKGKMANTPAEAADGADFIFTCVGNDNDLREVATGGNGLFNTAKAGSIFIDNSTVSAEVSRELNKKANDKGFSFLDAPISGGQAGAESGQLSIMIGGNKDAFNKIDDVLNCYSKFTKYMGKSGSGQLTKMVNQICIAGLIQALSEGINFSENVGLNSKDVLEVVSKGAAQSWQMDNRWETMLQDSYDHGFAVDLMRKDLEIVINEASKSNIDIDITKLVNEFYKDIQNEGGGRWDTSSLLKRLQKFV